MSSTLSTHPLVQELRTSFTAAWQANIAQPGIGDPDSCSGCCALTPEAMSRNVDLAKALDAMEAARKSDNSGFALFGPPPSLLDGMSDGTTMKFPSLLQTFNVPTPTTQWPIPAFSFTVPSLFPADDALPTPSSQWPAFPSLPIAEGTSAPRSASFDFLVEAPADVGIPTMPWIGQQTPSTQTPTSQWPAFPSLPIAEGTSAPRSASFDFHVEAPAAVGMPTMPSIGQQTPSTQTPIDFGMPTMPWVGEQTPTTGSFVLGMPVMPTISFEFTAQTPTDVSRPTMTLVNQQAPDSVVLGMPAAPVDLVGRAPTGAEMPPVSLGRQQALVDHGFPPQGQLISLEVCGTLGMSTDDAGYVNSLVEGQASSLGVRIGWQAQWIDHLPFSSTLLVDREEEDLPFLLGFKASDAIGNATVSSASSVPPDGSVPCSNVQGADASPMGNFMGLTPPQLLLPLHGSVFQMGDFRNLQQSWSSPDGPTEHDGLTSHAAQQGFNQTTPSSQASMSSPTFFSAIAQAPHLPPPASPSFFLPMVQGSSTTPLQSQHCTAMPPAEGGSFSLPMHSSCSAPIQSQVCTAMTPAFLQMGGIGTPGGAASGATGSPQLFRFDSQSSTGSNPTGCGAQLSRPELSIFSRPDTSVADGRLASWAGQWPATPQSSGDGFVAGVPSSLPRTVQAMY